MLQVRYTLSEELRELSVEFGLSPDYLSLLRQGSCLLSEFESDGARGWSAAGTTVWARAEGNGGFHWSKPYSEEFGHKLSLRLTARASQFGLSIGVERSSAKPGSNERSNLQDVKGS